MRPLLRVLLAATLVLAACAVDETSGGGPPEGGEATDVFPVTIEAANGPVEIPERPERIVSLSPTATEMLFAVEADDQVVAVDDQSTYPPEAPTTKLSGYEPNIEAIASYEPDLVVASDTAGLDRPLDRLGIPLLVQPAAEILEDTYAQIEELGTATGNLRQAEGVTASMREEIDEIVSSLPVVEGEPAYYHELDGTYYTVTSDTFIGHVYGLLGLKNIADKADKAGSGYPQLSAEYIIEADPDLIFLADTKCCNQTAETVAARPGWDQISAVREGAIVELDDDIASRWGPRVVDFLAAVAAGIDRLE